MKVLKEFETTLFDIPGEISVQIAVHGCKKNCKGCQWKKWNDEENPDNVEDIKYLLQDLVKSDKFKMSTCVIFYGGEWEPNTLKALASGFSASGKKVALYSGEEVLPPHLTCFFDYVKLGPYKQELGGLKEKTTNQKLFDNINHKEIKLNGGTR